MQQQALVLLAAFWAGTSAVFAGIKNAGDLRDKLVLGKAGVDDLPLPYLRRVFLWEWLPFKIALGAISLVLGVIIVMLPGLSQNDAPQFRAVCYTAAAMPFLGAVYQWVACLAESLFILRRMRELECQRGDSVAPPQ